jgi:type I restriction enzyme, R subunit
VYVNNVIKGKLLRSRTVQQQAANNTKEQFGHSPNLRSELDGAFILDILLNHAGLWEALRERAGGGAEALIASKP